PTFPRGRTRRREPGREVRGLELEQGLGVRQPAEPMHAEHTEPEARHEGTADRADGRTRDEDLLAMARRANAGSSVHGEPDVTTLVQNRPARVDADPESYAGAVGPRS